MATMFAGNRVPYGESHVIEGAGWLPSPNEQTWCAVCERELELYEDIDDEGHPIAWYGKESHVADDGRRTCSEECCSKANGDEEESDDE